MNCVICGTVKNCDPFLNRVFNNMEKIGTLFQDYRIIIYYDNSTDDTLNTLKAYQLKNSKFEFYVNKSPLSPYRTHNIAKGRNFCINAIKEKYSTYKYFIMMDCDDVCASDIKLNILYKNLRRSEAWDALSFNKQSYYDVWALSIYPYTFSCWHFQNNAQWNKYINKIMMAVPKNSLIKCYSAFNGFAIYKTEKFLNCYYDGRLRIDYIPPKLLQANIRVSGPLKLNNSQEDCEHRFFHYSAIFKNGARIRISPEILF